MFKHLLIATDGSPASEKALAQGLMLAKTLVAQATVVTVTEPWTEGAYATIPTPSLIKAYEKAAAGGAALVLEGVRKAAEEAGVRCQTRHIKDQHPAEGIIKAEGSRMRPDHRGVARARGDRQGSPRQHLAESPHIQPHRRSRQPLTPIGSCH